MPLNNTNYILQITYLLHNHSPLSKKKTQQAEFCNNSTNEGGFLYLVLLFSAHIVGGLEVATLFFIHTFS